VRHGDHSDFEHDGHWHAKHGVHWDEHEPIEASA
jgi:zinc transport system permease protein